MLATEDYIQGTSIKGWSLLGHIERPHAAMVMRDAIDQMIKGVRYQITSHENSQSEARVHQISFEGWCYKARGSLEHRSFLSFKIKDRFTQRGYITDYISDVKIMNKPKLTDENLCFAILKCSAQIIHHINQNDHFDISSLLQKYGLFESDIFIQSVANATASDIFSAR